MTGFGKATCQLPSANLSVEIKALNGKNLDVSVKIPSYLREKEQAIRNLTTEHLQRGKVDVFISSEIGESAVKVSLNKSLFKIYLKELKEAAIEEGFELGPDIVSTVARMPEVFSFEDSSDDIESIWPQIAEAVLLALEKVNEFRASEGAHIESDLSLRIQTLRDLSGLIPPLEVERMETLKSRLHKNLEELSEAGKPDPGRFEQELIYYLEKLDISEEKVRLAKHLDYFEETMASEQNGGKKLGFISQEIGREVNTLGSKANHAEMQKIVIMMKDELEKIKEQLMNVL